MTLEILAQGSDWLAVNKPPGLSVHNDTTDVLSVLRSQLKLTSGQSLHLAHRLDKETSGVLLLALNPKRAQELAMIFENRDCAKIYHAVLRGSLANGTSPSGEWNWPLTDKAEGRQNPQGLSRDRKDSRSRFEIVQENRYFSLVKVELLTGRQHQIRKHAALARHAIVGDPRYNDPKYNKRMADMYQMPRMFLHASNLTLEIDGKVQTIEAPLPAEFLTLVQKES